MKIIYGLAFFIFVFSQHSLAARFVHTKADFVGLSELNEGQQIKVKNWINHGLVATEKTLGPLIQKNVPIFL
ncbi:MAG: hypothetical protein AAGJ17_11465, partial [Pseudomonadota bacterium]